MNFKVSRYYLSSKRTPKLKFAFVSDLHDFENEPIIEAIISEKADAVLIGGDFIHGERIYKRGFEFLAKAAEIAPTFVALGNHETGYSGDLRSKIKSTGAVLLDNEYTEFKGIKIGGLTSGKFYEHNGFMPRTDWLEDLSCENQFKILLCHHPEYYEKYIKKLPIELTLSGHAHGGQWRFFGRGVYAPGQGIFPKYTSGMYDGRLLVSRGLGNLYFIPKINNPPEILIINI